MLFDQQLPAYGNPRSPCCSLMSKACYWVSARKTCVLLRFWGQRRWNWTVLWSAKKSSSEPTWVTGEGDHEPVRWRLPRWFCCSIFTRIYSLRLLFYWNWETLYGIILILKWQCQGDLSKGFEGNWIWKAKLCDCLVIFEAMLTFKIYVQKQAISIVVKWFQAKPFSKKFTNRRSFQSSFFSCKETNTNPTSLYLYNI